MHRARTVTRIDKNVKRQMKHEKGEDTMTGWLAKRRRTVQECLNGSEDLTYLDDDIGGLAGWTESHQKEFDFQQKKALKGKVEAYNYGSLLESEVEDSLLHAVQDAQDKNAKSDKEKIKDRLKSQVANSRMHLEMDWSDFSRQKVWVQATLWDEMESWSSHRIKPYHVHS
jgi:hypothetical protein